MSIPIYMRELMNQWPHLFHKAANADRQAECYSKNFGIRKATTSSTENQDKGLEAYERFLIQHSNRPSRSSETIWGICTLKSSHECTIFRKSPVCQGKKTMFENKQTNNLIDFKLLP